MRADAVVVMGAPVFDQEPGFRDGAEPVLVEAVIAEGTIEAFDKGVLHGFAWLDVVEADFVLHSPEVEGLASELGAVVDGDRDGKTSGGGEFLEDLDDGGSADGGIDMDGQTLTGEVIDDVQAAEAAADGELVMDEVHAPALVGALGCSQGHSGHCWQLFAPLVAKGESFLAVDALSALVVDDKPFGFEDVVEDGCSPPGLESRPVPQAMSQGDIAGGKALILERRAVPTGQAADPTLREPKTRDDFLHGRATRFGL